jgi:hypothetical protein
MYRFVTIAVIATSWLSPAVAEDCVRDVIGNLYQELETIDIAGEERLARSLDALDRQEGWSERERKDYTLSIADSPEVDSDESRRGDIIARMFGLAQQGGTNCTELRDLRREVLDLTRAQWDSAVQHVEQRTWH